MARTQPRGTQILDGTVARDDLDIATVGQSVVRKVVAGTNVSLSSTGADSGTGDVTINVSSVGPYVVTIGDGTTTSFSITHNLGTRDVLVAVYDLGTFAEPSVQVAHTSTTVVTLDFGATAPTTNQIRVIVTAGGAAPVGLLATANTWDLAQTFTSAPKTNQIDERTAASGVTIDGALLKDGGGTFSGIVSANVGGKTAITIGDSGAQNSGLTIAGDTNLYRASADTLKTDDFLVIGATSSGKNQLTIPDTTAGAGLTIGGDANLYRSAANVLKSDDALVLTQPAAGTKGLQVVSAATPTETGIQLVESDGSSNLFAARGISGVAELLIGADVNLYRSASNVLKTDDKLVANLGFTADAGRFEVMNGDPATNAAQFTVINELRWTDSGGSLHDGVVSVGASDSGGTGYRVLRVGNG